MYSAYDDMDYSRRSGQMPMGRKPLTRKQEDILEGAHLSFNCEGDFGGDDDYDFGAEGDFFEAKAKFSTTKKNPALVLKDAIASGEEGVLLLAKRLKKLQEDIAKQKSTKENKAPAGKRVAGKKSKSKSGAKTPVSAPSRKRQR